MDYEKKYKETIAWIDTIMSTLTKEQQEDALEIFPELAEPEDERIRKELLEHCKNQAKPYIQTGNKCPQIQSWIDWLEKQGETYTKRDVDDAWLKGMCDAKRELEKQKDTNVFDVPKISIKDAIDVTSRMQYIEDDMKPIAEFIMDYANWDLHKDKWNQPTLTVPLFRVLDALIQRGKPYCECSQNIEKQSEQKPANTVEQKCEESKTKIFDAPTPFEDKLYAFVLACEILVDPSKREFILEHSQEILDAAREQIGKEQKPAWSEEDSERLQCIIDFLWYNRKGDTDTIYQQEKDIDWLKSLKDRVQPQNCIYYNPYKEVVESIAEMCKHYDKASHSGLRDFYDNVNVKCKDAKEYDSLFPQNTWKPSDEQMEALKHYVDTTIDGDIDLLYQDLKELREE